MKYRLFVLWHGETIEDVLTFDTREEAEKAEADFKCVWDIDHSKILPHKEEQAG